MSYRVSIERSARKALDRPPRDLADRILQHIMTLAGSPRPPGSKKLVGTPNNWRIRVCDYRVLYEIDDATVKSRFSASSGAIRPIPFD